MKIIRLLWSQIDKITSLVALVSIPIALWVFQDGHDWNRREYAANMIAEWNEQTGDHRKIIEKYKPGLIDIDSSGNIVEITKAEAREIYKSKPNDPKWEVRFSIIELLNYMEFISMSYFHRTGDQLMIEESYAQFLVPLHDTLKNFIDVVKEERGYDPWKPYLDFVNILRNTPPRDLRAGTGLDN